MKSASPPEPGQCVGGYRLIRQIAVGTMTQIFEAVHATIGGRSAVKVLLEEHPDIVARFLSEARASNLVHHPNVVRIFDFGHAEGTLPYLAMEFLDGESLRRRLEQKAKLDVAEALRFGRQIAAGLAAAHLTQVVHRDLKPDNVMIVPDDEAAAGERAIIFDFGLARLSELRGGFGKTNTNMIMGTPKYMSPEQCKSAKHVTGQADVYSLGVVLFQMLAGRLPFVAGNSGDLIAMHINDAPPRLNELVDDCPPPLAALVNRMLSKSPDARPTMAEAATILREMGETGAASDATKEGLRHYLPTNKSMRAHNPTEPAWGFDSGRITLRASRDLDETKRPPPGRLSGSDLNKDDSKSMWRRYSLRRHWPWVVAGVILGAGLVCLLQILAP